MASQSHDELERFCANFDLLLSNINNLYLNCSIVLGDFNTKCSKSCASDKNNTAGIKLNNITTIDKSTHFINESSSCIDLIFSSNVNLTKNCGVEQSLYKTCHHNIIYGTLNFNIPLPPPYFKEILDYKNANIGSIQKSMYYFDWTRVFQNRNCNEKCKVLSEILLNIFHNFIPHEIKKFDYKTPQWINKSIKLALKKRSKFTKMYHSNPTANNKEALIIECKERYIAKMSGKLDNCKTVPKMYWSVVNKFK